MAAIWLPLLLLLLLLLKPTGTGQVGIVNNKIGIYKQFNASI